MKDLVSETLDARYIVTDQGLAPLGPNGGALTIELTDDLSQIDLSAPMIRIPFPSFTDGRGFTLARRLRQMGYSGHLRAVGHVLADQYAMARRVGFDDVEIDAPLAARQPEAQWLDRADWIGHDHRARLQSA